MPPPKKYTDEELRTRKNARSRERYQANKAELSARHAYLERIRMQDPEYREKARIRSAAWRAKNPDCSKQQNAKRRALNPELARQQSREWFAKNPEKRAAYEQNRRAKKKLAGGRLSPGLKATLYQSQKGICPACRCNFEIRDMHMDHVMPIALGGENSDSNIQLLCQPCNQSKHSKHPIDFMQQKGFLL